MDDVRMAYEEALIKTRDIMFDFEQDHIDTHGVPYEYGPEDAEPLRMAVRALQKQIPKPPVPDENATGIDGKPVPRCQVCGYAMDLRMEQYCPCCGQRLTEYEVDEK